MSTKEIRMIGKLSQILLTLVFSCYTFFSFAQTHIQIIEEQALPELPNSINSNTPIQTRVNQFLASQGLIAGDNKINNRTLVVFVGTASINALPSDNNFIASRINAFSKAMLNAKSQCAKFQASKITVETTYDFSQPSAQRVRQDTERLTQEGLVTEGAIRVAQALNNEIQSSNLPESVKVGSYYQERLLNQQLSNQLIKMNLDPTQALDEQVVRGVIQTESFRHQVRLLAAQRCSGLKAVTTFEQNPANGQGAIGVVTYWSERLHQTVSSVLTGNYDLISDDTIGLTLNQQIPDQLSTLLTTMGVQVFNDETGYPVILAFAQDQPLTKNQSSINAAYQKAELRAVGMIRSFLGETIVVNDNIDDGETSYVFDDETTATQINSSYTSKVQATAEQLKLSGLTQVHSWETLHPASQTPVVGVVMRWKISSAEIAALLRNRSANAGSITLSKPPMNNSSREQLPNTPTNSYSGQGQISADF
jgi:hypothetical protein